jgi:quinol monooxygenase YgiN
MFVVSVHFTIREGFEEAFMSAMKAQARQSVDLEAGCHHFDVCIDPEAGNSVLLYELYEDRDAFDLHLESDHYQAFAGQVGPWVADKRVNCWQREVHAS